MDFKDQIKSLASRVETLLPQIQTEEATKNALILPFIQILGYDVFNPFEVVPEFIADLGIKKGEKVDYAILKEGIPQILIECKHYKEKLDPHNSQLFRYFHVSNARFAILTNGVNYKFYTDLMETNKMDEKPFYEINLFEIKDNDIEELKKFHKSYFNIENIVSAASDLKYTNEIKALLAAQFKAPTDPFIRFFVSQIYTGRITEKVLMQFSELTKRSLNQLLSEMISERLKSALDRESALNAEATQGQSASEDENTENIPKEKVVDTTEEEKEAFYIVKSILRPIVDGTRIHYRDAQSYFSIILDDNNRKAICRLYLNGSKKSIGLFDHTKKENKYELKSLDGIYTYADQLQKVIEYYDRGGNQSVEGWIYMILRNNNILIYLYRSCLESIEHRER